MPNEGTTGVEDIVRRNIATLRAKVGLTQQGLADEMLLRGIGWTREIVAQVETTNRRIGFTEAIAVAACLDVPLARLTATLEHLVGQRLLGQAGLGPKPGDVAPDDVLDAGAHLAVHADTLPAALRVPLVSM